MITIYVQSDSCLLDIRQSAIGLPWWFRRHPLWIQTPVDPGRYCNCIGAAGVPCLITIEDHGDGFTKARGSI